MNVAQTLLSVPVLGTIHCHPEAAAALEGQSAPKDPQPETRTGWRNVN